MKPEMPELQQIRNSFDCTAKLVGPLLQEGKTISVMPVPEEFHHNFQQKFALHHKMQECTDRIKEYAKEYLNYTEEKCLVIDVPPDIHPMLIERYNAHWDVDSRIEVFENLRTHIEKEMEKPQVLKEIKNKCGADVNYILFIQGITSRDDNQERDYRLEIHFKKAITDVSLPR